MFLLAGAIAGKLLAQVFLIVAARRLSVSDFAALAIGMATAQILADLVLRVNANVVMRAASSSTSAGGLLRWSMGLNRRAILSTSVAFVTVIIALQFTSRAGVAVALAAGSFLPLAGLRLGAAALVVAGSNTERALYSDLVVPLIGLLLLVPASIYGGLTAFALTFTLGQAVGFAVLFFAKARGELSVYRPAEIDLSFTSSGGTKTFAQSTYWMSNIKNVTRWGDTLLIGAILGFESSGRYAAIAALPAGIDLITQRIGGLAAADGARVADRQGPTQLGSLLRTSSGAALLLAVPASAVLIGAASPILLVMYGGEFEVGAQALRLLILASLVRASFAGDSPLVIAADGHRREVGYSFASAVVVTMTSAMGAVMFGLTGFAAGRLIGEVVSRLYRYTQFQALVGVKVHILRRNLVALAKASAVGVGAALAIGYLGLSPFRSIAIVGLLTFCCLAILDFTKYRQLLNPGAVS